MPDSYFVYIKLSSDARIKSIGLSCKIHPDIYYKLDTHVKILVVKCFINRSRQFKKKNQHIIYCYGNIALDFKNQ